MSANKLMHFFFTAALVSLGGACIAGDPADQADDVVGASGGRLVADRPDGATLDNYKYYSVRPGDAAGTYVVRGLNLDITLCADGRYADACPTGALDLRRLDLGPAEQKRVEEAAARQQLIVQGDVGMRAFSVSHAWIGQGEAVGGGTFARVTSTGIVCVAAPCPSYHGVVLDTKKENDLAEVDLSATGLSLREVERARELIREPAGLIVAAKSETVTGPAGSMPGYVVNQLYLPVGKTGGETTAGAAPCYVGGCSAELCTDEPDAMSSCIFDARNECFRDATCERQPDLRCGWTPTDELRACLANPPALE